MEKKNINRIELKNRIKYYRKLYKYTQWDLGKKLGVSKNTISAWEIGDFEPSLVNIFVLLEIFNCTFYDMFYVE